MNISTIAMIGYFTLAGLVLLAILQQTMVITVVEGVCALVAAIALALHK